MKICSDIHTHTSYCDGNCPPVDLVKAAIRRGFCSIGISGHAYTPMDDSYCMTQGDTETYLADLSMLADRYREQIDVLTGTEYDLWSEADFSRYDYIIGACHYVKFGNRFYPVDDSLDTVKTVIAEECGGDPYRYCENYYESLAALARAREVSVVAHFDLVTKFIEKEPLFDETNPRYRKAALGAMEALVRAGKVFEINTGAMQRVGRTAPYPVAFLLCRLHEMGAPIVINSDSHTASSLGCFFDAAAELARSCGYTSARILTARGWKENPL